MIDGKSVALVIPTIRENCFKDFVERWERVKLFDHIDRFILMEDNPKKTFGCAFEGKMVVQHNSWEDISASLKDDEWIIPRRSDTVRSFGYLEAYRSKCDLILTLDDDCYPPNVEQDEVEYNGIGFLKMHAEPLIQGRSRWFNTLTSVKPRGIPFYNTGRTSNVIVNHGLWTNVLDYDAPFQLANPIKEDFQFDSRVVPAGLYFPMCGMNVMWKREATVLMYHLLMGRRKAMLERTDTDKDGLLKLPFDRFGDIWCGIFMKKIADMSNRLVTTGMPYIRHERASNPFANLKKEANGIEVNEDLWEHVDSFRMHDDDMFSYANMYSELGAHVAQFTYDYQKYAEYTDYFHHLGKAMQTWARLFNE